MVNELVYIWQYNVLLIISRNDNNNNMNTTADPQQGPVSFPNEQMNK